MMQEENHMPEQSGEIGQPCGRFRLDYYLDDNHRGPEHRYCVCGWTEAHHPVGQSVRNEASDD